MVRKQGGEVQAISSRGQALTLQENTLGSDVVKTKTEIKLEAVVCRIWCAPAAGKKSKNRNLEVGREEAQR